MKPQWENCCGYPEVNIRYTDLLLPLGLGFFRSSLFRHYYLYPRCQNFNKGIDCLRKEENYKYKAWNNKRKR